MGSLLTARRAIPGSGQWSQAVSDRLTGSAVVQLCQMHSAIASSRWAIRARIPRRCGRRAVPGRGGPLRVSVTDSIDCQIQPTDSRRGVSSCRTGAPRSMSGSTRHSALTPDQEAVVQARVPFRIRPRFNAPATRRHAISTMQGYRVSSAMTNGDGVAARYLRG